MQLVRQISEDHGYLTEQQLDQINPEIRGAVVNAMLKKDHLIGSTVITYVCIIIFAKHLNVL